MKKIQYFIITKSVGFYINMLSIVYAKKARDTAYKLFSQPRKGKLKKEQLPKTLQSAVQETFQYNEEKFKCYIWPGNEEIILLAHGWESNASRWKKLLKHLIPLGKTIIALDAPAHGLSTGREFNAPKYAEFINVVLHKYRAKTVIGHSIGGGAIAYYLNKYKNPSIEKVIMLGSPSDFRILNDNFIRLLSLNKKIQSLLEEYYLEKFNIHLDNFSGHTFALNFPQKALIAHDIEDKIVLVNEGRKYASTWKNVNYIETKGLGHSMHDDNLYKKIIDFILEE